MKRLVYIALIVSLMFCLSCGKMVDWAPVNLQVYVQDSAGKDLLDPENGNSWVEGTTLTFRGEECPIDLEGSPLTKDYMPVFYGFRIEKDGDRYCMVYGEVDGGMSYKNEEFIIRWPGGTEDVISLTRRLNEITINARNVWRLNGKKTDFPIVIVK